MARPRLNPCTAAPLSVPPRLGVCEPAGEPCLLPALYLARAAPGEPGPA